MTKVEKVVISGSTSFIGQHLIEKLNELDYKIYAIIRKNSSKKNILLKFNNVNIIELDMEEIDQLPKLINEKCDTFYHFAWNGTRGTDRNDKEKQEQNVILSMRVLESAAKIGCKTFFTSGSQAEYGAQEKKVNENVQCNPNTAYGKAKLEFYKKAKSYCEKNSIRLIEPRFFSIYGPGDFSQTLVMSSLKKMKNNEDVELSSCKQLWNFLYIKDAVNALVLLNENKAASGIFNMASNDTKPLKEFVLEMKDILNSQSQLLFSDQIPIGINPDNTRLKETINWHEKYSFEQGIKEISCMI